VTVQTTRGGAEAVCARRTAQTEPGQHPRNSALHSNRLRRTVHHTPRTPSFHVIF